MPQYLATRPMKVEGVQVKTGEPVPMERLTPEKQQQLIKQRRVAPDRVEAKRGPGRPRKEG